MIEPVLPNPEYVILAREARGLTQVEFAKAIELEQGSVSKIENGLIPISDAILNKIVEVLDFPKSYFLRPGYPDRIKGLHRRKLTMPAVELKQFTAWMTIAEEHLLRLTRSMELPKTNLPSWDVSTDGTPKEAARYVRNFWKITKGRLLNLSKLLEDNGVIIIPLELGTIDGFSTYIESRIPVIFLNRLSSGDRQRLTIAHELGHLVMHFGQKLSDDRDVEQEAYSFGGEFLIPEEDFVQSFKKNINPNRISLDRLAQLKLFWHVSMQAILKRAYELELISKDQYSYQWRVFNAKGMRYNEGVNIPNEQPMLLKEIFEEYQKVLTYSTRDLANMLFMNEGDFLNVYYSFRPKLKLVRDE